MTLFKQLLPIFFYLSLTFFAWVSPSVSSTQNPFISNMVSQVSQTNVSDNIWKMCYPDMYSGIPSKYDYINNSLASYGFNMELQNFSYGPANGTNIIASLPGTRTPEQVYILGSHWDPEPSPTYVGADDNTSGVSGLLEIARIMSQYSFESTIKFVAFDLEEWGLLGSQYYAANAAASGEDIRGVLIHEMIGYTGPFQADYPGQDLPDVGNFIGIGSNSASQLEAFTYVDAIETYVPDLPYYLGFLESFGRTDSQSFWDNSYNAIFMTDTADYRNPNYHSSTDIPDTLDMTFATNVTKASLATLASLAVPVPEPHSILLVATGLVGLIGLKRRIELRRRG